MPTFKGIADMRRLGVIGAPCVAVAAWLMTAATAHADHRDWRGHARSGWSVTIETNDHHGDRHCHADYDREQIEFELGSDAGWREGRSRGYDDGRCHRSFCNTPSRDLCSVSAAFARGYKSAFRAGYHDGYDQGLREYRCRGQQRYVFHRQSRHHHNAHW